MVVNSKDIEFLYEVGTLRNLERSWKQTLGISVANDLEHTIRVIYLALLIARGEGVKNEEKIMKMALVHDVAETRTNDSNYVHKVYVEANDKLANKHIFEGTSFKDFNEEILHEYEERKSIESKIVKDADNLDIDIELKELEERGSLLPKKWVGFRKRVRNEKLYTKTAKKIWDLIAKSDPASWHMKANKWVKIPKAGL